MRTSWKRRAAGTSPVASEMLRCAVLPLFALMCFGLTSARILLRCELANEILRFNVTVGLVKHWVCLAESESSLNTALESENPDFTKSYGIFQIHQYWCGQSTNPDKCDVQCDDLKNDDITDDFSCALKIYKLRRFSAWEGWRKGCRKSILQNISTC